MRRLELAFDETKSRVVECNTLMRKVVCLFLFCLFTLLLSNIDHDVLTLESFVVVGLQQRHAQHNVKI